MVGAIMGRGGFLLPSSQSGVMAKSTEGNLTATGPMKTSRGWIRHRGACERGDTFLRRILDVEKIRGKNSKKKRTTQLLGSGVLGPWCGELHRLFVVR